MLKLQSIQAFLSRWFVLIIILWIVLSGLYLAQRDSMTTDEGVHIASAYLVLTRGEFRFDPEHPYLFKMLTALPLIPLKLNLPKDDQKLWAAAKPTYFDSWRQSRQWAEEWFYQSGNNARLMIFLARLPAIALFAFLVWFIYYLGKLWFSEKIGRLALILAAFNPNLLANGHFADTDVPITLAILLSTWALWKYLDKPNWKNVLWMGVIGGATQLVKFSGIGIVPVVFIALLYRALKSKRYSETLWHFLAMFGIAWFMVWLGYGFQSAYFPDYHIATLLLGQNQIHLTPAQIGKLGNFLHYLFPSAFVKGLVLVQIGTLFGRGAYLFGHTYFPNIWYYFPVMFFFKTQISELLILLVGFYYLARIWLQRWQKKVPPLDEKKHWIYVTLGITFATYLALSIISKLDLGIRYLLPIFPILILYSAIVLAQIGQWPKGKWWISILLFFYILPVIIQLPNILGYVNVFVQPYQKSYYFMSDSNLDWGQQAKEVAQIVESRYKGDKIYANFPWSPYSLGYYGARTVGFNTNEIPQHGIVIVTATQLGQTAYAAYQKLKPDYILANNTFFYRT